MESSSPNKYITETSQIATQEISLEVCRPILLIGLQTLMGAIDRGWQTQLTKWGKDEQR